jgi:proliferating cell nuclear antigen
MLKAKVDVKMLSNILDSISAITPECRFHITESGITVLTHDSANVAMIKVILPKESFMEYIGTPSEMCVDIKNLKDALGKMSEKEVEILYTESSEHVELIGGKFKYKTRCLSNASVRKDPAKEPTGIPLNASFSATGQIISQAINATSNVSDKVGFALIQSEDKVIISSFDESNTMNVELKNGVDISIINNTPEKSLFSSDYMRELSRIFAKSDSILVEFGTDMPIRFKCNIQKFEVVYVVAPRIEHN